MSEQTTPDVLQDGSPPGHVEKMLNLGDAPSTQTTDTPADDAPAVATRPENIPEKFWDAEKGEVNVEALLKSQQDAEAALRKSQQSDETADETTDETPAEAAQSNVVEAASAEWAEKGELSDETFASLEKVGLSRDMVESYIAGQQAIIGSLQAAAYGPFGGEENYNAAANWAAENLSETEIKALDVQLTSANPDIVAEGAKALLAKYEANADVEPATIRGNSNSPTSGGRYTSSAEMMRDMASPRYRTDAGFRKEVMEKLSRSNL